MGAAASEAAGGPFRVPGMIVQAASIPLDPDSAPLWVREVKGLRFSSLIELYAHNNGWLLSIDCEGCGRFLITKDAIDVDWDGGTAPEHYLQTLGLSLWLELHGVLCLHSNILVRDDTVMGLMAPSQTGKTTLTAAFVDAGWTMLTDDMAALYPCGDSYLVYPSGPNARLWPDAGRHFCSEAYDACPPVHARFAKRAVPLRTIEIDHARGHKLQHLYLLERRCDPGTTTTFETLGPAETLVELMRHSMLGDASRGLGIEADRLSSLARLISRVPLIRMRYPSGLGNLDEVRKAVEKELERS